MRELSATLSDLTKRYLALHGRKEDLFWASHLALTDDPAATSKALGEAEVAMGAFLQDPARLAELQAIEQAKQGSAEEKRVLSGWIRLFAAHSIPDPKGRALAAEIVELEHALARKRSEMKLGFVDPSTGAHVPASSIALSFQMRSDPSEARRRAAFEGLRSIEGFVLAEGFLEIVRKRNELGRLLGYEDYYDWRVQVVERMSKKELFSLLDDLAVRTKARADAELTRFEEAHGAGAREPWNFLFLRSGELTRLLDPYFSFGKSLRRYGEAFAALGIRYRGATLTLDLLDRPGKYENGFMHGPGPAFFDDGTWRPARINFTANAIPGVEGSGLRATETLFHEGGHAAHFSNILQPAPCFSQEFAPTSVAYAETQSMFLDSLLGDADFRAQHAVNAAGEPMPLALIDRAIAEEQPFRAWSVRQMLTVPLAERALYELPDDALTPDRVLETFRAIERELQGLPAGVRPVLSVPHLLAGESSAYYHGYLLAEMAVEQTRAFFLARDGYLTGNAKVGPDLARHYWAPGNEATFDETLRALTGKSLSADALVAACDASVEASCEEARRSIDAARARPAFRGPVELDATIRVMHGREIVASTERGGFEGAAADFEKFVASVEKVKA